MELVISSGITLPSEVETAVLSAAEGAIQEALEQRDGNAIYAALGAATEVAVVQVAATHRGTGEIISSEGTPSASSSVSREDESAPAASSSGSREDGLSDPRDDGRTKGAGAWAVLGGCGRPLHDVLVAWDSGRKGTASRVAFHQAAQALAALEICCRTPTTAELDSMYDMLCEGGRPLRLARLLGPLSVASELIERRLRGVQCRTWAEIDKWADETYNWYIAGRHLRRSPVTWRDAPSSRQRNIFDADRAETTLHLFAAEEGGCQRLHTVPAPCSHLHAFDSCTHGSVHCVWVHGYR